MEIKNGDVPVLATGSVPPMHRLISEMDESSAFLQSWNALRHMVFSFLAALLASMPASRQASTFASETCDTMPAMQEHFSTVLDLEQHSAAATLVAVNMVLHSARSAVSTMSEAASHLAATLAEQFFRVVDIVVALE